MAETQESSVVGGPYYSYTYFVSFAVRLARTDYFTNGTITLDRKIENKADIDLVTKEWKEGYVKSLHTHLGEELNDQYLVTLLNFQLLKVNELPALHKRRKEMIEKSRRALEGTH